MLLIAVVVVVVVTGATVALATRDGGTGPQPRGSVSMVPLPPGVVPLGPEAGDLPPGFRGYRVPAGFTWLELDAFYTRALPRGADWRGWVWCGARSLTFARGYQRTYIAPNNPTRTLIVNTVGPSLKLPGRIFVGTYRWEERQPRNFVEWAGRKLRVVQLGSC